MDSFRYYEPTCFFKTPTVFFSNLLGSIDGIVLLVFCTCVKPSSNERPQMLPTTSDMPRITTPVRNFLQPK